MTPQICTVISLVHFWAAGATAGEEMKFCTTAAELCYTHYRQIDVDRLTYIAPINSVAK